MFNFYFPCPCCVWCSGLTHIQPGKPNIVNMRL